MEAETMQKYRPSNSTEGESFLEKFCYNCKYDNEVENIDCDIMIATMRHNLTDDEYPEEWLYGDDGRPCCTKFKKED